MFIREKVKKAVGVTAAGGAVTASVLGCVAFAQLQNMEAPKPIEELTLQGDPQTLINSKEIKELKDLLKFSIQITNKNFKKIEGRLNLLTGSLQDLTVMLEEQKSKLRKLREEVQSNTKDIQSNSISLVEMEKKVKALEDIANEIYGKLANVENKAKDLKDTLDKYQAFTVKEHFEMSKAKEEVFKIRKELKGIREVEAAASVHDYVTEKLDKYFGENWPTPESVKELLDRVKNLEDKI